MVVLSICNQMVTSEIKKKFLKATFVTQLLKTLTQLIVLFGVFKFYAASFNSITSSRVTV